MHRGLTIPDIVRLIVGEIRLPPDRIDVVGDSPDPRALAALARTSTTFLEPALDFLWSRQNTVLNLLVTFPDDLIRLTNDWPRNVLVQRPVSPQDWERPLFYSRRVKRLSLTHSISIVSTEAFEAISLSRRGNHMFPNLLALMLSLTPKTYESQSATSISFLISPQLKEIGLDFGTGFKGLSQIVPTLAVKCPSLTYVGISMDDSYEAATLQVVSDFVRSLARIQDLAVTNLDQDAFKHLGGLTSLKVLRLKNPKVTWMPALPIDAPTSPHHMYSSLTALHFDRTTVERVIAFIKVMSNAPLKELESHPFDDAATSVEIGRLYSALAAHCSHNSLESISLHGGWTSERGVPDQFRISGATLRTLFCFANIVSVSIYQSFGFDLTDADIFDLARAWPQLELLSLTAAYELEPNPPRATVQGFNAFALHCPNLRRLDMTVDATVPPGLPAGSLSQASLRMLDVFHSPISSPGTVATYLSTIFPQTNVKFSFDEPSEERNYRGCWEEVQQSLTDMRAQKHERDDGIERT
ncbi:hypothetical protein FB451DRAFT_1550915 [Mycena latifolia]|nr:hypothetical protein FB451DRAFT_1550915 [Mycena latifolia]